MSKLEEALQRAQLEQQRDTVPADLSPPSEPEAAATPSAWDFSGSVATAEHAGSAEAPHDWLGFRFGDLVFHKTVVDADVDSSLVEQYRRLAATLHHAQLQRDVRTVMISSAVAAEGKTLTATNLALTLSHSYKRRVLVIDADLRQPTVHEVFRIPNKTGLSEALGAPERRLPLVRVSPTLWILTAGEPTADPMGAFASDQMKWLLSDAKEHFDWVIIDTPPVAMLSDASLLAAMIDAAIVVIAAASTPYPLVRRAVESIGVERTFGVVLNRIKRSDMVGGYGYYDYYGCAGYGPRKSADGAAPTPA